MKIVHLLASTTLVAAGIVAMSTGPSTAATPQCNGQDATIVYGPEPRGNDTLVGTEGDDVIVVTSDGYGKVQALGGNDSVCILAGRWTGQGGEGDDHLERSVEFGELDGDAGDDTLIGSDVGLTSLSGGDGNDILIGRGEGGVLHGDAGNDRLDGSEAHDYLVGGDGDDTVDGAGGDDIVDDGESRDEEGYDVYQGGTGLDDFTLADKPDRVDDDCADPAGQGDITIDLTNGTITGRGGGHLAGFESYEAGFGVNTWIGTDGTDVFDTNNCGRSFFHGAGGGDDLVLSSDDSEVWGDGGRDDVVVAGAVDVTAHGGPGDDVFQRFFDDVPYVSSGARVYGGDGRDRIDFAQWDLGPLRVDLARGLVTSPEQDFRVQVASVEDATGGTFADVILGNTRANHLRGLAGRDRIDGRRGRDTAYGGTGVDRCQAEVRHSCERR